MRISREYLRTCFSYDKRTGKLKWRYRPVEHFKSIKSFKSFNSRHCGNIAGFMSYGYTRVCVDGNDYAAHRIIWNMLNGDIPDGLEIDHINHDRNDNKIGNLRTVSRRENMSNKSMQKNNKTGVCGVHLDARDGKYGARINIDRKLVILGYYPTIFEAAAARKSAENKSGYHQNHGKAD